MTDILTVATHFENLNELSQGLADRIDEERIILYGPQPYEEGSNVGFVILLIDGTPVLEGIGEVVAAVDGGDTRDPETRYDIVFDNLALEGKFEIVFERLLSLMMDAPMTGEVSLDEFEETAESLAAFDDSEGLADDSSLQPTELADAQPQEDIPQGWDEAEQSTREPAADQYVEEPPVEYVEEPPIEGELTRDEEVYVQDVSFEGVVEDIDVSSTIDSFDNGFDVDVEEPKVEEPPLVKEDSTSLSGEGEAKLQTRWSTPPPAGLTRRVHALTWQPRGVAHIEPGPSTGYFQYVGELPIPNTPPRPDLDASLRVAPAPHPDRVSSSEPEHENDSGGDEEAFIATVSEESDEESSSSDSSKDTGGWDSTEAHFEDEQGGLQDSEDIRSTIEEGSIDVSFSKGEELQTNGVHEVEEDFADVESHDLPADEEAPDSPLEEDVDDLHGLGVEETDLEVPVSFDELE